MRLDFNALWVDDQPDQLGPQITAIGQEMQKQGFEFRPQLCKSIEEVRGLISDNIFTDEVDLILVDWDLGGDRRGQDVIAEIRDTIPYKDVVFYSSLTSVPELKRHAFEAGAEGVFCASKGGLITEVTGVFEALIKKVVDLDHTRGIVMGATSDIDHMTLACLTAIDEASKEEEKKALLKKAKDLIGGALKNLEKKAKDLEASTGVAAMLEAHALFTANDRLRVLNTVLEHAKYDEHDGLRAGLKDYIKNIVPKRNELGHLMLIPAGKPGEFVDNEGRVVTLDEMREIRVFLLGFRSDFRKLRDALTKAADPA